MFREHFGDIEFLSFGCKIHYKRKEILIEAHTS